MRFLLDQDVYALTARFLRSLGHDVIAVAQIGHAGTDDSDLLRNLDFVTSSTKFPNLPKMLS